MKKAKIKLYLNQWRNYTTEASREIDRRGPSPYQIDGFFTLIINVKNLN